MAEEKKALVVKYVVQAVVNGKGTPKAVTKAVPKDKADAIAKSIKEANKGTIDGTNYTDVKVVKFVDAPKKKVIKESVYCFDASRLLMEHGAEWGEDVNPEVETEEVDYDIVDLDGIDIDDEPVQDIRSFANGGAYGDLKGSLADLIGKYPENEINDAIQALAREVGSRVK